MEKTAGTVACAKVMMGDHKQTQMLQCVDVTDWAAVGRGTGRK